MEAVKKGLDKTLYWISVLLFALLVCIVVWQVFTRQVLAAPGTWTDEGARLTFVWLGLFSSAFLFGERGHIAVEVVARKFPPKSERWLAVVVQLIVLFFALVLLVWGGWRASQNAWTQNLSALPFTFGQMYLALPISGILMSFYSIYYIVGILKGTIHPYPDTSESEDPELRMDKYGTESLMMHDDESDAAAGTDKE